MLHRYFGQAWARCCLGMLAILLVAGCGTDEPEVVTVAGTVELAGSQALPGDASARISMVEQGEDGASKRIVAERTLHDLDRKSIAFNVEIERDLIEPDGDYGLRGEILAADGNVLWKSEKPRPINPLKNESEVRLELVPSATDAELSFEQYRCDDGFHLAAAFEPKRAVVRLGNRRLVMPAAGRKDKFVGEHGNRLSRDGDRLTVEVDDSVHENCTAVASQTPPETGPSGGEDADAQAADATNEKPRGSGENGEKEAPPQTND